MFGNDAHPIADLTPLHFVVNVYKMEPQYIVYKIEDAEQIKRREHNTYFSNSLIIHKENTIEI